MEIKFDAGKRLYTNAIRHRFVQGENMAESITITGPKQVGALDLSQLRMAVRVNSLAYETTVEKTLYQTVEGENISLEWVVDKMFTAVPGPVSVTLVGYGNEEEVIKITSDGILVKADDVNGTAPPESTWEQLLAEMQQFATQTYQNAQAAAASEANAKASETASAASAQEAQTSKTAAAASAQEAKNAAATAAQDAAEQAAAEAAAQTEAQIRSYADDRYARALKATAGPAEQLTIYPDEGSILQITVHGATVQAGSGDPSPVNVRAMSGVGKQRVEQTFSSSAGWNLASTIPNFFYTSAVSSIIQPPQSNATIADIVSSYYKPASRSAITSSPQSICVQIDGQIGVYDPTVDTVQALGEKFSANPLTVWFIPKNTSDATGWYTWEAVDGDTYAAVGLPLNGPLYDGDSVTNDVPSGFDKTVVFDGSEDEKWILSDSGKETKRFGFLNGAPDAAGGVANCAANRFTTVSDQSKALQRFPFIAVYAGGFVDANVPGIETEEDWRRYLSENPETLYYKSTIYTQKNDNRAEIETHGDIVYTLTGEETYAQQESWAPGSVTISTFMLGAASVDGYTSKADIRCSHLVTETPANISNLGKQGCGQGGGTSLYLNFGDPYNTKELAVQYIKDQYAAGTPVQIKAKRATPAVYAHPRQPLIAAPVADGKITVTGEGQVSANYNKSITRAIAELQAAALALGANLSI